MKTIKLICIICFLLLISIQYVLYGENQLKKYKFYEGPDLPVDKLAILQSGNENVFYEKCVFLVKIDDIDYKGSTKGFEVHLMPGMHYLTVSYSAGDYIGESIVITFDAIAGKKYKILGRPLTFSYSGQQGKMVAATWRAWVEDVNPDQETLAHIAKNDVDPMVRIFALQNPTLTDQSLLADIAKNDEEDLVRRVAVRKLTDQTILTDIAKNDKNVGMRGAAVRNITDQALLTDIAKNDKDPYVRRVAVENLNDQTVLTDFAKNDENSDVRLAAVKKLTDQAVLADIAKNDENKYVCKAAKKRLKELKKK